ncbi:hypothetical protein [Polaribacter sp.]|uniref:hypothetical protein n=1 Tax=Polaribacter sp. TaxID=1920175 RepID=UPI003F69AAD2
MSRKKLLFFTFLLGLSALTNFSSQEIELKFTSSKKQDSLLIYKYDYKKKHVDSISLSREIVKYLSKIKKDGYFLNRIDRIIKRKEKTIAYITFNEKINFAKISFEDPRKEELIIKISELEKTLNLLSANFEAKGNSFTKLVLENSRIKNDTLISQLKINQSKQRKINKVIVRGYDKFPKSFLKNYFKLNESSLFNNKKLNSISNLTRSLSFVEEIKKPEVLFTKDSTIIYMYLKKRKNNSFDGLINLSTQENGSVNFNGYLDLKLNNILNKEESFNLKWNNYGDERQELAIRTKIPFIFKSKISPEIKFSIYKQDSTFLNSLFNIKLNYVINYKSELSFFINNEKSEKLTGTNIENNLESFNTFLTGVGYQYNDKQNYFLRDSKFYFGIETGFGKRKNSSKTTNQTKIETTIKHHLKFSDRSFIYLKNKVGILNSKSYLFNELFRIGGPKTIRGYAIQSIFSKNYTTQNIEFRYLTSQKSYLYTITDFAIFETIHKKQKLFAFGLGYLFNTKTSQINITAAVPGNLNSSISFKNTQLLINWVNIF